MHLSCPNCETQPHYVSDCRNFVRHGHFHRTSDSRSIERYRCLQCKKTFSKATKDPCFAQKKRQKNKQIWELLASGVSQRRIARLLRLNRTTIARKLIFLGEIAQQKLFFQTAFSSVVEMQFDDLETIEHSKYKPVSAIVAIEVPTRRVLGFRVAQMGAKGRLARIAIKKYGKRKDERSQRRKELFQELKSVVQPGALIRSDSNPYYARDVKKYFPNCVYQTVKSRRAAVTGQGELKGAVFDPIFSLNHTFAMFRANLACLIRKTWTTTKRIERLADRMAIYSVYHNENLA